MSGNINPQEVATQFLMGDHIREDICSRTNLPILMAMELQTEIMACGEMTIALPKTKTGRIKKEVVKKLADGHEHVVADLWAANPSRFSELAGISLYSETSIP